MCVIIILNIGLKIKSLQFITLKGNTSQQRKAKTLCDRMYRKYQKLRFIIDDESYFTLSHESMNVNDISKILIW